MKKAILIITGIVSPLVWWVGYAFLKPIADARKIDGLDSACIVGVVVTILGIGFFIDDIITKEKDKENETWAEKQYKSTSQ